MIETERRKKERKNELRKGEIEEGKWHEEPVVMKFKEGYRQEKKQGGEVKKVVDM
jgi:hypothetical protein